MSAAVPSAAEIVSDSPAANAQPAAGAPEMSPGTSRPQPQIAADDQPVAEGASGASQPPSRGTAIERPAENDAFVKEQPGAGSSHGGGDGHTLVSPAHGPTEVRDARALIPAFCGLVLLGLALVFLAWWGARIVRRQIRQARGPTQPLADAWYSKPLATRPPPPTHTDGSGP